MTISIYSENEKFVMELDDDTDALQATVYYLQKQLKEATATIDRLKTGISNAADSCEVGTQNQIVNGDGDSDITHPVDNGIDDEVTQQMDTEEKCEEKQPKTAVTNGHNEVILT